MHTFYVSSFGKNTNKGIYIVHFDETSDELSIIQHIVTKDYPSYMVTKIITYILLTKMLIVLVMAVVWEVLRYIKMN